MFQEHYYNGEYFKKIFSIIIDKMGDAPHHHVFDNQRPANHTQNKYFNYYKIFFKDFKGEF